MDKEEQDPVARLTAGAYREGMLNWPRTQRRSRMSEREAELIGEDLRDGETFAGADHGVMFREPRDD